MNNPALKAIVLALLLATVGCEPAKPISQAQAMTMPSDADALCATFGGVKALASQSDTIRPGKRSTSVAAYCADGSYVSRHVDSAR